MAELSMNKVAGVASEGVVPGTGCSSGRDSHLLARVLSLTGLAGVVAACSGGGSSDAPVDSLPLKPSTSVVQTTDAPTTSIGDPIGIDTTDAPTTTESTVAETTTTIDLFAETYFGYVCDVPGFTDQPAATNLPDSALPIAVLAIPDDTTSVEFAYLQASVNSAIVNGSQMHLATCVDGPAKGQEVVVIINSLEAQKLPSVTMIGPDGSQVVNEENRSVLERVFGNENGRQMFDTYDPSREWIGPQDFVPAGVVGDRLPQLRSFSEFGEILGQIDSGELFGVPDLVQRYRELMTRAQQIEADNALNGTDNPVPMFAIVPTALADSGDRSLPLPIVGRDGMPVSENVPVETLLIATENGVALTNPLITGGGYYRQFGK